MLARWAHLEVDAAVYTGLGLLSDCGDRCLGGIAPDAAWDGVGANTPSLSATDSGQPAVRKMVWILAAAMEGKKSCISIVRTMR